MFNTTEAYRYANRLSHEYMKFACSSALDLFTRKIIAKKHLHFVINLTTPTLNIPDTDGEACGRALLEVRSSSRVRKSYLLVKCRYVRSNIKD